MSRAIRAVVVGGGVGGLVAAGCLARAGLEVTLLEAHIYVGGCAGTFYHRGYRFDAGATLSAGFQGNGPFDLVGRRLGVQWRTRPAEIAMVYRGPDGRTVARPTDRDAWRVERRRAFGDAGEAFWRWQEATADALWGLALERPPWPPGRPPDLFELGRSAAIALSGRATAAPGLAVDAFRTVSARLSGQSEALRLFIDAQLLISSQASSDRASALHGAAALDLPHRGVVHLEGGMGALVEPIARAVQRHGGRVILRREATKIAFRRGRPVAVETKQGDTFACDLVIVNLPPPDAIRLAGPAAPEHLRAVPGRPDDAWGAFVVYVGLDGSALPASAPIHQQIALGRPLGEGRTVFASLSLADDSSRAPAGHRAATLSTHTRLEPWWELMRRDFPAYEARQAEYVERLIDCAELAVPGFRAASRLILPGSPVVFERFTHRVDGWVGGYPQTGLLRNLRPRLGPGLWLVGDSIFPGQSTPAVALGALRVADQILRQETPRR